MDKHIDQLRPTQAVHGEREVRRKADAYRQLSPHDLKMAIAEKPIPIVLGPDQEPYATDHHHVAAALWMIGVKSVPVVLLKDLSSCSPCDFWFELDQRRWTHPYDKDNRRIAFVDMPRQIWALDNDEYRSLAAAVRDAGGYEKTDALLEEFRWSDLFRAHIDRPLDDAAFEKAIKQALKLAASDKALGLPGFKERAKSKSA